MRFRSFAALPLMLLAGPVKHRTPQTVVEVDLSTQARTDISIMAAISKLLRIEQARCIGSYSTHWASDDTLELHIEQLEPAEVAFADSIRIAFYKSSDAQGKTAVHVCHDTFPLIHTHILDNGFLDIESARDDTTEMERKAPFAVLVSVRDSNFTLHIYGLKR